MRSAPPVSTRLTLSSSPIGLVEDLRSSGVTTRLSPEGFSPQFQVCFPYHGAFSWHIGPSHVVSDATQCLYVTAGEAFRVGQSWSAPFAELIITPDVDVLEELAGTRTPLARHPLFTRRSARIGPALQLERTRFLHHVRVGTVNDLKGDELLLAVLRASLATPASDARPSAALRRLTGRAKEYLHAHLASRIRLSDVAKAVSVSPAHLTTAFTRVEGTPMHRYLTELRLARALTALPGASDLTALALDTGFSSHSHFTAVFRRAFGLTPSEFRMSCQRTVAASSRR
jgi:AraC-like DNA-binding protein